MIMMYCVNIFLVYGVVWSILQLQNWATVGGRSVRKETNLCGWMINLDENINKRCNTSLAILFLFPSSITPKQETDCVKDEKNDEF